MKSINIFFFRKKSINIQSCKTLDMLNFSIKPLKRCITQICSCKKIYTLTKVPSYGTIAKLYNSLITFIPTSLFSLTHIYSLPLSFSTPFFVLHPSFSLSESLISQLSLSLSSPFYGQSLHALPLTVTNTTVVSLHLQPIYLSLKPITTTTNLSSTSHPLLHSMAKSSFPISSNPKNDFSNLFFEVDLWWRLWCWSEIGGGYYSGFHWLYFFFYGFDSWMGFGLMWQGL